MFIYSLDTLWKMDWCLAIGVVRARKIGDDARLLIRGVRSSVGNAASASFSYWNIERPRYQYRKYLRVKKCWDTGSAVITIDSGLVKVPRSSGFAQSASLFTTRLTLVLTG